MRACKITSTLFLQVSLLLSLVYADAPEPDLEEGQVDGALAHAIEALEGEIFPLEGGDDANLGQQHLQGGGVLAHAVGPPPEEVFPLEGVDEVNLGPQLLNFFCGLRCLFFCCFGCFPPD